jgi:hypothetical protein
MPRKKARAAEAKKRVKAAAGRRKSKAKRLAKAEALEATKTK